MKIYHFLYLSLMFILFSCGQSTTPSEESGPGPMSETDRQRYNINPSDEMHHETLQDSLMKDSLAQDSL